MPGSETSKVVRGASAPASSSSRSSSSRGLGQYCGAGTGQSCQTGRPDTVARMVAPVVVAEIVRSGFVEGHHYGSWVALDADGSVRGSAGDEQGPDPSALVQQATAGAGDGRGRPVPGAAAPRARLRRRTRASPSTSRGYAASSPPRACRRTRCRHRRTTRSTTRRAKQVIRSGGAKAPVLMNCSGKHAAMLATCVANDWPRDTYLEVDHPLQQAIAATFARMTGEPVAHVAVDGCGAPLLATSLVGLARAFSRLATSSDSASTVAEAIRAHPEYVSGTQRDELTLLRADPRRDRQGRGGVLLRRGPSRRACVRHEDRRRGGSGATGADGRAARALRGHRGARCGRRRGPSYG